MSPGGHQVPSLIKRRQIQLNPREEQGTTTQIPLKSGRTFSGNLTKREEKLRNYKAPLTKKTSLFSPKTSRFEKKKKIEQLESDMRFTFLDNASIPTTQPHKNKPSKIIMPSSMCILSADDKFIDDKNDTPDFKKATLIPSQHPPPMTKDFSSHIPISTKSKRKKLLT